MLEILVLALILITLAFIGLAITIIIKKNGTFPKIHVHDNQALKEEGITCATKEDIGCSTCSCEHKKE